MTVPLRFNFFYLFIMVIIEILKPITLISQTIINQLHLLQLVGSVHLTPVELVGEQLQLSRVYLELPPSVDNLMVELILLHLQVYQSFIQLRLHPLQLKQQVTLTFSQS